jgi:hypothetical protein
LQALLALTSLGAWACAGGSSAAERRTDVAAGGATQRDPVSGGAGAGGGAGLQAPIAGGAHAGGSGDGMASTDTAGSGGAGEAGGAPAGGDGGATASDQPVIPSERNGRYALEFDDISFEVDPRLGGRVTRFALAGRDTLATSAVHAENWGSTFWPSPQSAWGWPPPAEIDSAPYQGRVDGDAIVLVGATSAALGLRVTKRFRADPAARAVVMEFVLHNDAASAASWAPWQITRVPAGGLTFFPTGTKTGVRTELAVQQSGGITWYAHDFAAISAADGQKYVADGAEGWMAQVKEGLLLLKRWGDVPAEAQHASEGEVEIYANKAAGAALAYVEVECQGPLTEIAAAGTLAWSVTWYLREVPGDVLIEPGSEGLAAFARSLVR